VQTEEDVLQKVGGGLFIRRDRQGGTVHQLTVPVVQGAQGFQIPSLELQDQVAIV